MTGWGDNKGWGKPAVWPDDGKPVENATVGWDTGSKDTTAVVIVKDGKILDAKTGEEAKAFIEATMHGQSFMQDGKHIPIQDVTEEVKQKIIRRGGEVAIQDVAMQHGQPLIEWPKGNNKIPTHDPYTNPGAYLYYECKCGKRLDPHTKRFAELNNAAMKEGWRIRWGSDSYVPYCVECGKDIE